MARNTVLRSMHDLGLAAWFGGSLMGAVGLNAAAAAPSDPRERSRVANAGWDRWTPLNGAAIGAHLLGAAGLLVANRQRLVAQQGVASMSLAKTALTGAALAVTALARAEGAKVSQRDGAPVAAGAEPLSETPEDVTEAQQRLRLLQWAVPASTGALLLISAYAGEQQRASEVRSGVRQRLTAKLPG